MHKVQLGFEPSDWTPMVSVGAGVREVRVREGGGAFRVLHVTRIADAVHVLHAFRKKTRETPRADLATARLQALMSDRDTQP